jgi:CcmD family protein
MKRMHALVIVLMLIVAPALAGQTPQPPTSQDGFVPVSGPTNAQETIPAQTLVGIAYGFIWVLLFGYVWSVRSRLARVEREMDSVSRRIGAGKK